MGCGEGYITSAGLRNHDVFGNLVIHPEGVLLHQKRGAGSRGFRTCKSLNNLIDQTDSGADYEESFGQESSWFMQC